MIANRSYFSRDVYEATGQMPRACRQAIDLYDRICREKVEPAKPGPSKDVYCAQSIKHAFPEWECKSIVFLCKGGGAVTLMYELVHAVGVSGGSQHGSTKLGHVPDLVERIDRCLDKDPMDIGRGWKAYSTEMAVGP